MADMTVEEAMEKYGPQPLRVDDLLVLDDPNFVPENVAIVTGAGSGIGRATALAFADLSLISEQTIRIPLIPSVIRVRPHDSPISSKDRRSKRRISPY